MQSGSADTGGQWALTSIGSISCKSGSEKHALDVPLVDGKVNQGIVETKLFGDFYIVRGGFSFQIYIRTEQLEPFLGFLGFLGAAPSGRSVVPLTVASPNTATQPLAGGPSAQRTIIDVRVMLEKTHQFVPGLKSSNFRIYVDGLEQKIEGFKESIPAKYEINYQSTDPGQNESKGKITVKLVDNNGHELHMQDEKHKPLKYDITIEPSGPATPSAQGATAPVIETTREGGSTLADYPADFPKLSGPGLFLFDTSTHSIRSVPTEAAKSSTESFRGVDLKGNRLVTTREILTIRSGPHSPFRVPSGENPILADTTFLYLPSIHAPFLVADLFGFRVSKKEREGGADEVSTLNGATVKPAAEGILAVSATKFKDGSWRIIPKNRLVPGEYALRLDGAVYTFGIDF